MSHAPQVDLREDASAELAGELTDTLLARIEHLDYGTAAGRYRRRPAGRRAGELAGHIDRFNEGPG